jgi:hypothetical protein
MGKKRINKKINNEKKNYLLSNKIDFRMDFKIKKPPTSHFPQ